MDGECWRVESGEQWCHELYYIGALVIGALISIYYPVMERLFKLHHSLHHNHNHFFTLTFKNNFSLLIHSQRLVCSLSKDFKGHGQRLQRSRSRFSYCSPDQIHPATAHSRFKTGRPPLTAYRVGRQLKLFDADTDSGPREAEARSESEIDDRVLLLRSSLDVGVGLGAYIS